MKGRFFSDLFLIFALMLATTSALGGGAKDFRWHGDLVAKPHTEKLRCGSGDHVVASKLPRDEWGGHTGAVA